MGLPSVLKSHQKHQELQLHWQKQGKNLRHLKQQKAAKKQEEPFYEIDDNRLYFRTTGATPKKGDFFSTAAPLKDDRGVFATRDVLVRSAASPPLYDFPKQPPLTGFSNSPIIRPSTESSSRNQRQHHIARQARISAPRVTASSNQSTSDWSILDELFSTLCGVQECGQEDYYMEHRRNTRRQSRKQRESVSQAAEVAFESPLMTSTTAAAGLDSGRRLTLKRTRPKKKKKSSSSRSSTRQQDEKRVPPQLLKEASMSVEHNIKSPSSVLVYPIVKYRDNLDSKELVEQRRRSLREHLTFQPLKPAFYFA